MKNKKYKYLNFTIPILILLEAILFFSKNINCMNMILGLIIIIPSTIIMSTIYKKFLNKSNDSIRYILIIYFLGLIIIEGIVCLTCNGKFLLNTILNSLMINYSILLTYLFIRRTSGREKAILIIPASLLFLPNLLINEISLIETSAIFIPITLLYIIISFDYNDIFRKKNIIRLLILVFCLVYQIFINVYYSIALVLIFTYLVNKKGSKKTLGLSICIYVIYAISLFLSTFYGININAYEINNFSACLTFETFILAMILLYLQGINLKYIEIREEEKLTNISTIITLFVSLLQFKINTVNPMVSLMPILVITYIQVITYEAYFKKHSIVKSVERKDLKKVSAIIPNYNYAHYINERIDSILNQKYPIYELIILDDKSSDNSVDIINEKIKKIKTDYPDLKVKFIVNKTNSGNVFKQWAKAFETATGDYIWIAEADDLSSKYFLSTVMQGFNKSSVIMSYAESNAIDENGKMFKENLRDWIDIYGTNRWSEDYISSGKDELKNVLCINNTIANVSSVVFKNNKKIDFKKYLKESQKYILAGDWYFYSMVLLQGDIAYYSRSLNYHRIHSNSVTHTTDNFVHYKEILKIQENIKSNVKISKKINELIELRRKDLRTNLCISDDEIYYDSISLKELLKKKNINDEVLLSIIIPVYNTEKYLNKCFKSFIKTLPIKTEVIVINDGTKDNSEDIILKYANEYDSIKYIKKENGGLSSVKNLGLSLAKGKYIIYLDSDDYVSSNMYSTMLKKAIDKDADMVFCDVLMVFDKYVKYCCCTNYEEKEELNKLMSVPLMAASWNKMVKKDLYKGLKFPEKLNNEDIVVTPLLFLRSKNTMKVETPFYKYVQREGSIQNSGFSSKRFMIFDTAQLCFNTMKKEKYSIELRKQAEGCIITHQIIAILLYLIPNIEDTNKRREYIKEFCDKYNKMKYINNNNYITEYLNNYNVQGLENLIKNNDILKIDKMLGRKFYEK